MYVDAFDIVLLFFLIPCVSASRIRLAGDKDRNGELFVPRVVQPAQRHGLHRIARFPQTDSRGILNSMRGLPRFSVDNASSFQAQPQDAYQNYSSSDGFQVFIDIDDTLYGSGGPPAGLDRSLYKHEIYPGAFQFMLELSRGPNDSVNPSKVVPLSARPVSLKFWLSMKENTPAVREGNRVGQANGLPSWGLDLEKAQYGKLIDFVLPRHIGIGMNRTRFHSWKKFDTHKPTVYLGDNGPCGDLTATARMALESDSHLQCAFLHDVRPKGPKKKSQPTSNKIHLFNTYYDAAKKAFELGVISRAGMERVQQAFKSSSIVQICLNEDMFTDRRYPCVDTEKGILVDAATMEPLPTTLKLDLQDGTALLPDCSDKETPRIDPPRARWSRCSRIHRALDDMENTLAASLLAQRGKDLVLDNAAEDAPTLDDVLDCQRWAEDQGDPDSENNGL